jgi:dTDP-4-dehydrorhamnose reductase
VKTLILGAGGLLGRTVLAEGDRRGAELVGLGYGELDITDARALTAAVERERPQCIVNCAALTAVDACERRRDEAVLVNGRAVADIAGAARSVDADLLHLSTDYVFDGSAHEPYTEFAAPAPLSVYGESKLLGEAAALSYRRGLVLRTSWLFGAGGPDFVTTMAGLIRAGDKPLRVVDDEVGCPTYAPFLARAIWDLIGLRSSGILHYRNRDPVSWYEFASEIASLLGDPEEVVAISRRELARPAARPAFSVLDVSKFEGLLGRRVERWRPGLVEYLTTIRDKGQS